jgi:hypothetical protein
MTAKKDVVKLHHENRNLRSQLQSLRRHLALHKSRVQSAYETKRGFRSTIQVLGEKTRLVEEQREHLISVHSNSVRGAHASQYQAAHTEYVHLQDQFRKTAVDYALAQYLLQKLIIDVANQHEQAGSSQRVVRSTLL